MEPEWQTRQRRVDPMLEAAGWKVARFDPERPLSDCTGQAVKEYPTEAGPADYALVSGDRILGVVEAKKLSLGPQGALTQAERYSKAAAANPSDFDGFHVPFLYSTNGQVIWFHDIRHPLNRSRRVARFHTPAALEELLGRDTGDATRRLLDTPNDHPKLRPYQVEANAAVEQAISDRKRQMLVAMATGTGKTFTLVNQVYRLNAHSLVNQVDGSPSRRPAAGSLRPRST